MQYQYQNQNQMINQPLLGNDLAIQNKNTSASSEKPVFIHALGCTTIGERPIPYIQPNVHPDTEIEDIQRVINSSKDSGFSCCDIATMGCCTVTVLGAFFAWSKTVLINSNQYGFIINSGQVVFLRPGWHYLGYPFMEGLQLININETHIKVNNLQIVRIRQDEIGIAVNNTALEVLLPGTHVRIGGGFIFQKRHKLSSDIIEGPVKILTVRTGTVLVCYDNGVARVLSEGRYAVNSNGFTIGSVLDITQQNLKFKQHRVLLEGGINMLVEGLLTYQIIDVGKCIKNVDYNYLNKYLEDVMKADLTKIFSAIHLEQIASTNYSEMNKHEDRASETRLYIYENVMKMIKPQADQWGIQIINFQLESTQLADKQYSLDYEAASLQIAKSKAELRAQEAQNLIRKQKAETEAKISQLNAETQRSIQLINAKAAADALIMQAEAKAEAIKKEGNAKAAAADMMESKFGKDLALLGQKVKIAEGLKIHTLVMGGDGQENSNVGSVVPVLKL